MKKRATLVQKVHEAQWLRHIVANKLSTPLTVLRYLREGRSVPPTLIELAIKDLEALMKQVDEIQ